MATVKVQKAVIAAAGWSTRFLPAVKAYAKPLVPILEKPNIQYLVEEIVNSGIKEIAIVHRHGEKSIKQHFTPDEELESYLKKTGKESCLKSLKNIWKKVKFRFIPQPRHLPYGNATPILAAKGFIDRQPFIYMYGDDLVLEKKSGNYLGNLIKIFEKYQPAAVAGSQKVPLSEISKLSSVKYANDPKYPNRVETVIEKPSPEKAYSNVCLFGRFVISPQIFAVLEKQEIARGELWLTDAINTLAQKDVVIAEPIKQGKWMTTGDPLHWLQANIELALHDPRLQKEISDFIKKY
jgi:UTP--glucose-1-phosphate uridylyltransferase